ncbi:MAG: sensor histidine kinase, partial [Phycisphaerales bacterium]
MAVVGIAASVALGVAGATVAWNGAADGDVDPPSEQALRQARVAVTATIGSVATLATFSTALLLQTRRQRRAQAALERARSEADAASRAKTDFLANMSHEIRTPMAAILGYVDLLADGNVGAPGAPTRDEAVDTIRRNARHLLSVLNDMLDLSKIESGHMDVDRQPVRTLDLVQDVMRLMDDRARRRGIALKLALEGDVPEGIVTDPTRLRQILINLVGNAVKFTEHG